MMRKHLSWKEFCSLVLATDDVGELESMLRTLKRQSHPSLNRMLRVHGRLNKLRAEAEREVLRKLSYHAELRVKGVQEEDAMKVVSHGDAA